jgi:hypothetical protein
MHDYNEKIWLVLVCTLDYLALEVRLFLIDFNTKLSIRNAYGLCPPLDFDKVHSRLCQQGKFFLLRLSTLSFDDLNDIAEVPLSIIVVIYSLDFLVE